MAGYENLCVVVYHQGPPVFGVQAARMKILDVEKSMSVICDAEFPLSRYSRLKWIDFSKDGLLCSLDSDGQFRAFSLETEKWTPVYDFRDKFPSSYKYIWVVGV